MDGEAREELMCRIAGEIILSQNPGKAMRKWRNLFELTQTEVAKQMGVSPSVISDYENDRRKSPGTLFIKRFVKALVAADELKGGNHVRKYAVFYRNLGSAVIDMDEFEDPISAGEIASVLEAEILAGEHLLNAPLYGYTVIDSIKAIKSLDAFDFLYLLGRNPMRVVVFTEVERGRSPLVAARLYPVKPKMIVIHGPESGSEVDELAIELAEAEKICFALCRLKTSSEIAERLRSLKRGVSR